MSGSWCLPPVAESLGDMHAPYLLGTGEVRDGAGDPKNPVEAPCRKSHRGRSVGKQLAARIVRRRNRVEQLAVGFGISPDAKPAKTPRLDIACRSDTPSDLFTALGGRRKGQVGGADALHLYMKVYAVEQWA